MRKFKQLETGGCYEHRNQAKPSLSALSDFPDAEPLRGFHRRIPAELAGLRSERFGLPVGAGGGTELSAHHSAPASCRGVCGAYSQTAGNCADGCGEGAAGSRLSRAVSDRKSERCGTDRRDLSHLHAGSLCFARLFRCSVRSAAGGRVRFRHVFVSGGQQDHGACGDRSGRASDRRSGKRRYACGGSALFCHRLPVDEPGTGGSRPRGRREWRGRCIRLAAFPAGGFSVYQNLKAPAPYRFDRRFSECGSHSLQRPPGGVVSGCVPEGKRRPFRNGDLYHGGNASRGRSVFRCGGRPERIEGRESIH